MPDCGSGTVDLLPPHTSIDGLPFAWHTDAAPVRLSLAASEASSPPAITYYRIGAGPVTTYTAPFEISAEGTTTVRYWSKDSAVPPNVEAEQVRYVRIDRGAPTLAVAPAGEYATPARVAFSVTDAHSGVAFSEWRLDGARLRVPVASGSTTVSAPGVHTLSWVAIDAAGNEATGAVSFTVKRAQSLTRAPAKPALTLTRVRGVATYRASVTVKATPDTSPFTGFVPLAGKTVLLQSSTDGVRWKTVATRVTSATGVASHSVRLTRAGRVRYRWFSPGDSVLATATSPATTVTVR